MDYTTIYTIAQQGMEAAKLRLDSVANNIANQYSISSDQNTAFIPTQVITKGYDFHEVLANSEAQLGIAKFEIVPQNLPPNPVYEPGHPHADKSGYVTYPGVRTVDEMTTLLQASRAYEANIKIMNSAHNLYLQCLSIGSER